MRKILKISIVFMLLFALLSVYASAYYSETGVHDNANIIRDEDEAKIKNYLSDASAKTGVKYILITSTTRNNIEYEFDTDSDCIALNVMYVDGTYYYDLFTYGTANEKLSNRDINNILDDSDVYDNLKSGDIDSGVKAFCAISADALYVDDSKTPLWKIILISAIIAIAISLVTVGCIIYKYKRKLKSPSYPLERYANLDLKERSDVFVGSFVKTTRIASSSGGRSGGGRSGGGGRRGGR